MAKLTMTTYLAQCAHAEAAMCEHLRYLKAKHGEENVVVIQDEIVILGENDTDNGEYRNV